MADVLKVKTEKLQETAGQFKSHQANLQTAYLTMSDAVRSLDTTWNGEASEQFKAQFDSMYKNLSQTEQKMGRHLSLRLIWGRAQAARFPQRKRANTRLLTIKPIKRFTVRG